MNYKIASALRCFVVPGVLLASSTLAWAAPVSKPQVSPKKAPAKSVATITLKSQQGYSMVLPAGFYKLSNMSSRPDEMFVDRDEAVMSIMMDMMSTLAPVTSLEGLRRAERTMMKNRTTSFKVLSEGSTLLNGTRTLTMTSTFLTNASPKPRKMLSIILIRSGKAYAFRFSSPAHLYPRYEKAFKKSLASLRWTQ